MAFSKSFFPLLVMLLLACSVQGQLLPNFYNSTCPRLQRIVRSATKQAINKDPRMGAAVLRIFFHDCFVTVREATATISFSFCFLLHLHHGFFSLISCSLLHGPRWQALLGRRDSRTAAGQFDAGANLPPADMEVPALIGLFASKGLDAKDMVALSGSHTIGETRCGVYRSRIYNDNNVDPNFAAIRKNNCPPVGGDNIWTPLDLQTPTRFDNKYYRNLLGGRGILHSDQALYSGGPVDSLVKLYSANNSEH
ncbi:hypothetical protein B296_00027275 [Ensete ventricosum]|uniref:Plant heme peroxidase family profile domain-containing protein n=1 Tax=Ensete ventricosum TaxID=4639 RepID=A0A427A2G4_ENSVE|nr:hypothetical protein B296_00027275 [Ensete ventricosum]